MSYLAHNLDAVDSDISFLCNVYWLVDILYWLNVTLV
jgi:hypothetical protein